MSRPTSSNLFRVALVGTSSLNGREVRDVLSDRNFPSVDIKLLDDEELAGKLEEVNGEPTFVQGVTPEQLEGIDFAFLTAAKAYIERTWATVRDSGAELIDLSYALENNTDALLRSPWLERELGRTPAVALQSTPVVVAHPAATALALIVARLQQATEIRLVSAVVAHPASEYGRAGMDELHDQTVNLLSFQQLPSAVFGTQAAFNLFSQPQGEAQLSLAEVEARIQRHYRIISGGKLLTPAVLLIQAPVFHGYTLAMFVQTAKATTAAALEGALAGQHVSIQNSDTEFPSNVSVAGSSEVLVSVRADGSGGNGYWVTAACDNLRVSAIQAVECAEEMALTRPRGKLQ